MRKFLRTKRGLLIAVCVLFTSVLGLSYATFIVNNGSYKATELLISKLNYGITIVEDGSTGSTIDNNSVTIPSGKTGYYVVTITSINSINTKYSLGYKTTSNATVQYTDRTAWEASGDIKGYDENTYSKKVRIVIDNSGNSSSATVSFAAFGGYTYRTIAEINLTDGYKTVTGPFTELAFSKTNKLIDIVEGDTSCTTSDTTNCLYGGGNLKNYVQFPEDEDKTKNIWRIVGSYDINGSYVTKLISETLISTTSSTYVADLTTFYNTLTGIDTYIEETNYFNCYSTSCTANTNFTNIGLLTDYEFNEIGGVNTYLNRKMPFIVNSEEGLKEVTTSGYNETVSASTNARAVIYLKNKTHVINSGTETDPYILSPETDVAIIGYTVNGKATSDKFEDLLKTNLVNQITCDKGTTAVWDNETSSIKLSNIKAPDYCTIDFKDGFTVTLTAGSTGTVSAPVSQMIGYNGTVSFTVTPASEYQNVLETNTCGGTLSGNTYTVSKVTSNKSCSITFKKNATVLSSLIKSYATSHTNGVYNENGYRYEGTNPNNYIYMTNKSTNKKERWRIIGVFNDGANGEEVIRVRCRDCYLESNYDLDDKNYFPNTTIYNTLSSTYNLNNYSHTVNYKMYLGTSSSPNSLTASGWYTAERGTTPGQAAADSYNGSTSFIGSGGLMYPSDYGYAVLASDCPRTKELYNYNGMAACHDNNWLYQVSQKQWLISPSASYDDVAFLVSEDGDVYINGVQDNWIFSPVMALSSDVLVSGSGTEADPYVISM